MNKLTHLKQLEAESIHIMREVIAEFENLAMLYNNLIQQITGIALKSHLSKKRKEFIDVLDTDEVELISKGSSIKVSMVDDVLYPRLTSTMEGRDTAFVDIVVRESYQFENNEATVYDKESLLNPWSIVSNKGL